MQGPSSAQLLSGRQQPAAELPKTLHGGTKHYVEQSIELAPRLLGRALPPLAEAKRRELDKILEGMFDSLSI